MSDAHESVSFKLPDGALVTAFRDERGQYKIGDITVSYNANSARKRRWVASFCGLHVYATDPTEAFSVLSDAVRRHYLKDASTTLRAFELSKAEARDV